MSKHSRAFAEPLFSDVDEKSIKKFLKDFFFFAIKKYYATISIVIISIII